MDVNTPAPIKTSKRIRDQIVLYAYQSNDNAMKLFCYLNFVSSQCGTSSEVLQAIEQNNFYHLYAKTPLVIKNGHIFT